MAGDDDSSSSSSDDSDHEKRVAAIGSNTGGLEINSDSDEDDDLDLDGVQLYANQSKGRGANRNFRSRRQVKAMESVLSDKDSDDEDGAEMKPVENPAKKPSPPKRTVYEVDSSSDSEVDEDTGRKRPSIADLAKEGKVDETTAQNAKLAHKLLHPVICVDSTSNSNASDNAPAEDDQLRDLTIRIQGYDTVQFSAPETSTAREVLTTTLEMLRLPPKTSIGCLRHGERTLLDHQILMELPPHCDLTATIMGDVQQQKRKVDVGPLLRLQIRVGVDDTKTVQLGQHQVLRDLGFAKLRFDGDILDLDKPASFYELEEDDLLDVPGA